MADLPADSDFHVDEEAAVRASNLLAVMSHNFAIIPPRVMPQDADSVVFTWDHGNLKRYLTVDSSDFGVMDLNKSQRVRCVHDLGGTADAYTKLIEIIGAEPLSSTNTGGNA
ncbi:hypothetical protein [Rhizobium mayense]|uniref:Uncharacterized protein n=1 Tax=Rhizobium mayense TaxID=1312184 RepID=A0ABT7K3R3_9HYPH|nr:hypothetical protein [Rhizobium mayense]MDL2403251.1 hypothetical protein [Rhizobium mayense]